MGIRGSTFYSAGASPGQGNRGGPVARSGTKHWDAGIPNQVVFNAKAREQNECKWAQ